MLIAMLTAYALLLGIPFAADDVADERPAHASTVDELIEQLREDPILVQPSMGMGDSGRAHDILTDLAADVDLPVYVVLAELPEDLSGTEQAAEQAAAVFRDELGDGLYHVDFLAAPSYTGVWGAPEGFSAPTVWSARREAEERRPGDYNRASALFEAVLVLRAAAEPSGRLPESAIADYENEPWAFAPASASELEEARQTRVVATVSTAVGLVVAGILVTLGVARAKPLPQAAGGADRRQAHEAVPDNMDFRAKKRLDDVRRRLAALSGDELTSEAGERAATAIDAAEQVLSTGDDLDAVGAYVLALTAHREVDRITEPDREPFRPCFINPMHGEAHDTIRVEGSSLDAPVCTACARRQGAFLALRRPLRGWLPYVETSTVWARTGYGSLVDDLAEQVLEDRSVSR